MNQTLYAFFAVALATLFAVNQQRNALSAYQSMIRSEFEIMGNGVAIEKMEFIAGSDFEDLGNFDGDAEQSSFQAGNTTVPFALTVEVTHVDAAGNPASPASDYAQVVVNVTRTGRVAAGVSHARIFSR